MSKLHHIGVRLKTINQAPGHPTGPLPGSLRGPVPTKRTGPSGPPKITRGTAPSHDPRYQLGPQDAVPEHFSAYLPGIDPSTGKSWGKR